MTRDEMAVLFERRQSAWNRLDAAELAGLHAMDGVVESPFAGGVAHGREAIEQVYRAFFAAFSTATFRQEDLLIDGERAVLLHHIDGTNHGGLFGLAPTERPFSLSVVSLFEFRDGLITRERRIYDFTGLLIQVGAIKVKPA
jgi:steroid delta-isomerase-like uncharacterized protein